jgi:hypothetical protein
MCVVQQYQFLQPSLSHFFVLVLSCLRLQDISQVVEVLVKKMTQSLEIDPEVWLNFLLTRMSDKQEKQKLIEDLSRRSEMVPDQVEEVLHSLTELMLEIARSN